jgi:hypothetical protein
MPAWELGVPVLLIAAAIAAYAAFVRWPARDAQHAQPVAQAAAQWTTAAGEEFANLSEAERCDLVFAFAALDDARSLELLERALEDPSEAVALAAARAVAQRGRGPALQRYLDANPGERSRRIAQLLELLA